MAGIEAVIGEKGFHSFRETYERINAKYLKPIFMKSYKPKIFDASQLIRGYNKITVQEAKDMIMEPEKELDSNYDSVASRRNSIYSKPAQEIRNRLEEKIEEVLEEAPSNNIQHYLENNQKSEMLYRIFSRLLERKVRELEDQEPSNKRGKKNFDMNDIEDDYIEILKHRHGFKGARSSSSENLRKFVQPIGTQFRKQNRTTLDLSTMAKQNKDNIRKDDIIFKSHPDEFNKTEEKLFDFLKRRFAFGSSLFEENQMIDLNFVTKAYET